MSNIDLFSSFLSWQFLLVLTFHAHVCLDRYEWQCQRQILYCVFHCGYVFFACRWKSQRILLCWNHTDSNKVRHQNPPRKGQIINWTHFLSIWLCNLHCVGWGGGSPIIRDHTAISGPLLNLVSPQAGCISKYLAEDRGALFQTDPLRKSPLWWFSAGQSSCELHLFAVKYGLKYSSEPDHVVEPFC